MLAPVDAALAARYPGDHGGRQPIHTIYVPADRLAPTIVEDYGTTALHAVQVHGPLGYAKDVRRRVAEKLRREPIEDLRIDFEDGYGTRDDATEDAAARIAGELAGTLDVPFIGLRCKSLEAPTRRRAVRTLQIFLDALGTLPDGFVVTLPKVSAVEQVEAMTVLCGHLDPGLRFEIQIETPPSVLGSDGTATARPDDPGRRRTLRRTALRHLRLQRGDRHRRRVPEHGAPGRRLREGGHAGGRGRHRGTAVRRVDQRPAGRRPRGRPGRLATALPARPPFPRTRLLPGLGPAPGAAADPLRGDVRVLPGRPGRGRAAPVGLPRHGGPAASSTSRPPRGRSPASCCAGWIAAPSRPGSNGRRWRACERLRRGDPLAAGGAARRRAPGRHRHPRRADRRDRAVRRAARTRPRRPMAVLPGLVDTHVHVNEPGRTEWEGFATATRAAAAGGVTSIVDMPLNSLPPTVSVAALEEKRAAASGQCTVDVGFWGGAVPGNAGELPGLHDGRGVRLQVLPRRLRRTGVPAAGPGRARRPRSASVDALFIVHAEDPRELRDGARVPRVRRLPRLAAGRGRGDRGGRGDRRRREGGPAPAHPAPVLRAGAAAARRGARPRRAGDRRDLPALPVPGRGNRRRPAPPSTSAARRSATTPTADALWAGLADGAIDLVVSDHSPCPPELKRPDTGDFAAAWGGIASLQLGLPIVWTEARRRGHSLADVARWMATRPAELAGLRRKGRIAVGGDADLVALRTGRDVRGRPDPAGPPPPGHPVRRARTARCRASHLAARRADRRAAPRPAV